MFDCGGCSDRLDFQMFSSVLNQLCTALPICLIHSVSFSGSRSLLWGGIAGALEEFVRLPCAPSSSLPSSTPLCDLALEVEVAMPASPSVSSGVVMPAPLANVASCLLSSSSRKINSHFCLLLLLLSPAPSYDSPLCLTLCQIRNPLHCARVLPNCSI